MVHRRSVVDFYIRKWDNIYMDKLTKKQKGFIKDYIKTGNGTQSALNNYDTTDYSTAGMIASENLRKPKIAEVVKSLADRIPDELLEKVHIEGLSASDEVRTPDGEVIASKPDYNVRHKYLDTAYKLKKLYEDGGGNKITNFIFGNSFEQNNESY